MGFVALIGLRPAGHADRRDRGRVALALAGDKLAPMMQSRSALAAWEPRTLCRTEVRTRVSSLVQQEGDFHVDPELSHVVVLNDGFKLLHPNRLDVAERASSTLAA